VLGAAIRISPFSRGAVETGVGVVPDGYMFGPNLDVKIYRLQVPLMLVLQGSAGPGAFGGVGAAGSVIVSCSRTPNTLREGVGCEYVEVAGGYLNAHEEWDVDLVLMGGMRWLVGGRLLSARLELRRGTLEQVPADPRSIHRRLVSIVVGYGFDLGS
jgi:hypothetical protein